MNQKYKTNHQRKVARNKVIQEYQKRSLKNYNLRLHKVNDAAVIEKLESVPNKAEYLRNLILADINKNK